MMLNALAKTTYFESSESHLIDMMDKRFKDGVHQRPNNTRLTLPRNETILRQSPEHNSLPKNLGKRRSLMARRRLSTHHGYKCGTHPKYSLPGSLNFLV